MKGVPAILLALALSMLVFGIAQTATPAAVGVDGLYHMKAALMIRDNLPRPWMDGFRWLELTAMRRAEFADFHWGFHVLLVPFTFLFRDPEVAAKVAPVVLSSASLAVLLGILRRMGARRPFLWYWLAVIGSPIFVMRLSQNKAPTAMLGLLLAATWALLESRPLALGLACLAATWTYPVLPMLGAMVAVGVAARAGVERRLPWKLAGAALVGTLLGLATHPDFPQNLRFFAANIVDSVALQVGEYNPLSTLVAVKDGWIWIGLWLLAFRYARFRTSGEGGVRIWTGFLTSSLLIVLTARHMRGIDYLPPFVALFAAAALDDPLSRWLEPAGARLGPAARRGAVALCALVAVLGTAWQAARARQVTAENTVSGPHRLEAAAKWLSANTSPGEIVVNLSAGDFEQLWLYDTHNTYFVGVNTNSLRRGSPRIFAEYARFYERGDLEALARLLRMIPGARYLLASDRLPAPRLQAVGRSSLFEIVYRDRSCLIARPREEAALGGGSGALPSP